MLRFVAVAVTRLLAGVAHGTGFPTPQGHAILADENFYENMYRIFFQELIYRNGKYLKILARIFAKAKMLNDFFSKNCHT
jgi:hypothetical protein